MSKQTTTFRCVICTEIKPVTDLFSLRRCDDCMKRAAGKGPVDIQLSEGESLTSLDLYNDNAVRWEGDLW